MSKKENLLKFWESLDSSHQTSEVIKPFRPQSLKIKSKSQVDLLCPRPSIVPSKAQLHGWRGVTGSMDAITATEANDDQGGDETCLAESEKADVESLPDIPRNEILTHTTKSRARRTRTYPTRQKKTDQVPCVQVNISEDEQMNPYQTPPAAANEFSSFKHSPTSASFLDKSPLPPTDLDASSSKPTMLIAKPSTAFTTFLSNPLKFTKAQEIKPSKKESPVVPKRNLIPSSPKVSPRHVVGTEGLGNKSGCGQLFPGKVKSPFHGNSGPSTPSKSPVTSSKANFNEHTSSLKSVSSSKIDISERRSSLKVVSTPYKSLQAGLTHLTPEPANLQPTSPRIARLTANFQAATSSPACKTAAVKTLDLESDTRSQLTGTNSLVISTIGKGLETGKVLTTQSTAGAASSSTLTCTSGAPPVLACVQAGRTRNINMEHELMVKEGNTPENQDFNVFKNEVNKKVKELESAVAEEKLARIKLEKEVSELRLIVTKLSR